MKLFFSEIMKLLLAMRKLYRLVFLIATHQ